MSYEVIDNFLPETAFESLSTTMMSPVFPWFYNSGINGPDGSEKHDFQFTHLFHRDFTWQSSMAELIFPLVNQIEPKALIRVKANLGPVTDENIYGGWHNDFDFQCQTGVFYVNSNNGWTEFENGERVESVANRLVIFDSNMKHSGVSQTDEKIRVLINLNWM